MAYPIITIAREYGSGGRLIGLQVAKDLDLPFYDKELIGLAAKESGFAEDFVRKIEQTRTVSFLYNIYMNAQSLPASDQVFLAQSRVIQDLAQKGPCVIVGRCADYVLRDRKDCMNVFIHAPLPERVRRAREEYGDTGDNLESVITKRDKSRSSYYNYFTQNKWGSAHNYHLTINSSVGIPTTVSVVETMARSFL